MTLLAPEALQRLQTQCVDRLELLLTKTEDGPVPELLDNLESLSNQVVQIVAGFMSLRPKEGEKERELFVEVFKKLMVLDSRIKEYYHQRETFLSADRKYDIYHIASTISWAQIHYTNVLDYSESQ